MGRPSSYVSKNPATGKWNWYSKCGENGPGGYSSKLEASIDLKRHHDRHGCSQ